MAERSGVHVLEAMLGPLRRYYERADTEEIAVVRPGLVFRRLRIPDPLGRLWTPEHDENLSYDYLLDLAYVIAATNRKGFDGQRHPALWASLPGKHRVMVVAGPAVFYGRAWTRRRNRDKTSAKERVRTPPSET